MFQSSLRLIPTLVGNHTSRGFASLSRNGVSSNAFKNVQNSSQSMKAVSNMSTVTALKNLNTKALDQVRKLIASGVLLELRPPTPAEIPRAIKDLVRIFKEKNWRNLTIREAWLNTLVTTEVICWFFVGEVIGKGTIIGYQV